MLKIEWKFCPECNQRQKGIGTDAGWRCGKCETVVPHSLGSDHRQPMGQVVRRQCVSQERARAFFRRMHEEVAGAK
jgi:tRNA(Ile2) C34 agmatinyltransferase TiaS